MDDFNISSLHEAKNEWATRLITILTPLIAEGYVSIFNEAYRLCMENKERDKYLMTFQNFITRVPKWNQSIIEQERKRICEKSKCEYLEDLISCVHIIQLKVLTSMRVGNKQKKISINIPKIDDFIHKIYINVARKLYKNVYLFEVSSSNLETQKNNRAFEILIQECILLTIRDSIPIESIIKSYMDETIEEEVIEEIKEEIVPNEELPVPAGPSEAIQNNTLSKLEASESASEPSKSSSNVVTDPGVGNVSFNDIDFARDEHNTEVKISAPKTIERLEELEKQRAQKQLETNNDDDLNDSIRISDINVDLNMLDINDLNENESNSLPDILLDDIEVLE
jgi:hypothetical protein